MQRRKVDLPEPDGPITHATSPGITVRSTPAQHLDVAEALVDADGLDHRPALPCSGHVVPAVRARVHSRGPVGPRCTPRP